MRSSDPSCGVAIRQLGARQFNRSRCPGSGLASTGRRRRLETRPGCRQRPFRKVRNAPTTAARAAPGEPPCSTQSGYTGEPWRRPQVDMVAIALDLPAKWIGLRTAHRAFLDATAVPHQLICRPARDYPRTCAAAAAADHDTVIALVPAHVFAAAEASWRARPGSPVGRKLGPANGGRSPVDRDYWPDAHPACCANVQTMVTRVLVATSNIRISSQFGIRWFRRSGNRLRGRHHARHIRDDHYGIIVHCSSFEPTGNL